MQKSFPEMLPPYSDLGRYAAGAADHTTISIFGPIIITQIITVLVMEDCKA